MPHDTSPAYPVDLDRVLAAKSVRDAGIARARARRRAANSARTLRRTPRDRLERLMRVEEHFQALLLYDQLEFLRGPDSIAEAERDFALTVQRICLEAANGIPALPAPPRRLGGDAGDRGACASA